MGVVVLIPLGDNDVVVVVDTLDLTGGEYWLGMGVVKIRTLLQTVSYSFSLVTLGIQAREGSSEMDDHPF